MEYDKLATKEVAVKVVNEDLGFYFKQYFGLFKKFTYIQF